MWAFYILRGLVFGLYTGYVGYILSCYMGGHQNCGPFLGYPKY